jgi:hypothetical protein
LKCNQKSLSLFLSPHHKKPLKIQHKTQRVKI